MTSAKKATKKVAVKREKAEDADVAKAVSITKHPVTGNVAGPGMVPTTPTDSNTPDTAAGSPGEVLADEAE